MRRCKYCEYCKQIGRQQSNRYTYGRKHYYCKHQDAKTPPNIAEGFICFGENNKESKITIKTSPRWCPLKDKSNIPN